MNIEQPASAPAVRYETFDQIAADVGDALDLPVTLEGTVWQARWMHTRTLRQLRRDVPAGTAKIVEANAGRYVLEIRLAPESAIARDGVFDTLEAAAHAAEIFAWDMREQAGLAWYVVGNLATSDSTFWKACVRETEAGLRDHVEVTRHGDGHYAMRRQVDVRDGESYEVTTRRWNEKVVTDFAEACAIAVTLPTFVAALCDRGQATSRECDA
jgi:hypothetical protein